MVARSLLTISNPRGGAIFRVLASKYYQKLISVIPVPSIPNPNLNRPMKSQLLVLCLLVMTAWGCQIAFRLDEVQDYTDTAAQIALINYFSQSNIPLTLGIVANKFGSDPTIFSVVQNVTYSGKIEIAANGWNYELFSNYSIPEQVVLLEDSRAQIQTLLPGVSVISFIAPYDIVDNTTFLAVQQAAYKILTANPTDLSCPVLVAGSEPSYALPDSGGVEKPDVQIQLSQCNFSIIRLQPVNYALPGNQVDNTSMSNLGWLFTQLSDLNCTYQLLRDLIPASPTSPPPTTTNPLTTPGATTTSPPMTPTTTLASPTTSSSGPTTSPSTPVGRTTAPSVPPVTSTPPPPATPTNPSITTIPPKTTPITTSSASGLSSQLIMIIPVTVFVLFA